MRESVDFVELTEPSSLSPKMLTMKPFSFQQPFNPATKNLSVKHNLTKVLIFRQFSQDIFPVRLPHFVSFNVSAEPEEPRKLFQLKRQKLNFFQLELSGLFKQFQSRQYEN